MCTVLLPPGVYPIAVKYIISYYKLSYQLWFHTTPNTMLQLKWTVPKFTHQYT